VVLFRETVFEGLIELYPLMMLSPSNASILATWPAAVKAIRTPLFGGFPLPTAMPRQTSSTAGFVPVVRRAGQLGRRHAASVQAPP